MSPRRGAPTAIGELVDDEAVLIGERGRHALAFDTRHLETERDDQCRVHGGGEQGLEPRDQLVLPHAEAL